MATLMSIGETVQLTATVLDQIGEPVEDAVVTWQSDDEAVATVSAGGLVTAVRNGGTRITAVSGTATAGIAVSVMQSAVSIVIEPRMATLMSIGETVQLTATVLDQIGEPVEDAVVTWQSDDEAVATVSAGGLVTAVRNGGTRITATSGAVSESTEVTVQIHVPSPDRDILISLYHSMDGPNWKDNTNWLSEDRHVDGWFGVNTDEEGRVTSLNLGGNNLHGQVPAQLAQLAKLKGLSLEDNRLTGLIPPELGQLSSLTVIYLFDNQLTGPIPLELGRLVNLIHLCLNGNQLAGTIPPELGGLSNLKWLHLHFNTNLSGALPVALIDLNLDALLLQGTRVCVGSDFETETWLNGIPNARVAQCEGFDPERIALEALFYATNGPNWIANRNWLSDAPLEDWHGVDTDSKGRVTRLRLHSNGLSGTIPQELAQLSNLNWLDLSYNQLTGEIPAELAQLTSLEKLKLSSNHLTGNIPTQLQKLTSLKELRLHINLLTGFIPSELGQLTSLTVLELGSNRLTGSIPSELGDIPDLESAILENNLLSGKIPSNLGQLANLRILWLNHNRLDAGIPPELGQLSNLNQLYLQGNQLNGTIPEELGKLTNLTLLNLAGNRLTGIIPSELGNLKNLTVLSLGHNLLSEQIPVELGQLTSLVSLGLRRNNLTGSIPAELGQLTNLGGLVLEVNHLTGVIPPELGQLSNLRSLVLLNNDLTGSIPVELGQLGNLAYLLLGNNPSLAGPLPRELLVLSLEALSLGGTELCVPVDTEFQTWLMEIPQKKGIMNCEDIVSARDKSVLVELYQKTDGPNWTNNENWLGNKSIDQWFGIKTNITGGVERLNLENNGLNGTITGKLGRLSDLRGLQLGGNPLLTGTLPRELTGLFLDTLRLDGTRLCAPSDEVFQTWLMNIPQTSGVFECEENVEIDDRSVLVEFYHATDGENWKNNRNWLSDAPLGEWYGVSTDTEGRVSKLELTDNNLAGPLPQELGRLTDLRVLVLWGNSLTGGIPAELGRIANLEDLSLQFNQLTGSIPFALTQLINLRRLRLGSNQLTGSIPPELGELENLLDLRLNDNNLWSNIPPELARLTKLISLDLRYNQLSGNIPSELRQLTKLELLNLASNRLSGNIPSELGQLTSLYSLRIHLNQLTGEIPIELGHLTNLSTLDLPENRLSGDIPPELGKLTNLRSLTLYNNRLTGNIPAELGQIQNLQWLRLDNNQLTGGIPAELGQIQNLRLRLDNNQLTGGIPAELGQLTNLSELNLNANQLTGKLPSELGRLINLKSLVVAGNKGLAGSIPESLTSLRLEELLTEGTGLCIPPESDFQSWFQDIASRSSILPCRLFMNPEVYLTQTVQSFRIPVPLVEGEPALMRVFFSTEEVVLNKPAVRAVFFHDGAEVHSVDIPAGPDKIPFEIDEGSLEISANAIVAGSYIKPGLELVLEIDPNGMFGPESGIDIRIPETGKLEIDVRKVPPLNLNLVPMLWIENPDEEIVMQTEGLTDEDDLFRFTRDLLPVQEFNLEVHEPLYTSVETVFENVRLLLDEIEVARIMDGSKGHFMGVLGIYFRGGIAHKGGLSTVSRFVDRTIAHELGHNFSLDHAPCGSVDGYDPYYPYEDGSIGAWGYDFTKGTLVDPLAPDLMSYCRHGTWISDYHFQKAIHYRTTEEESLFSTASSSQTRSLLLWGGLNENGDLFLEPSFVVDTPPTLPRAGGPYKLEGEDDDGNRLFELNFALSEIADGEGGGFAFTIPVRAGWSDRLNLITLSGPEGFVEITRDSGRSAALLLDQSTGKVRGILRDWPKPGTAVQGARRVLPESGLDVIVSQGIPDPADW